MQLSNGYNEKGIVATSLASLTSIFAGQLHEHEYSNLGALDWEPTSSSMADFTTGTRGSG